MVGKKSMQQTGSVTDAARLGDAGPADQQRFADTAFVEIAFALAQRRVDRRWRVWPLDNAQAAVIRREHHERVVGEFQLVELGEHTANAVIEAFNHGSVDGIALLAGSALLVLGDDSGFGL